MIMRDLGHMEDEIFKERQKTEERFKAKAKRMKLEKQRRVNFEQIHKSQFAPVALGRGQTPNAVQNPRQEAARFRVMGMQMSTDARAGNSGLEAMMRPEGSSSNERGVKRKADEANLDTTEEEEDDQAHDEVRLWEDGFKDRYYESKFDVTPENIQFRYSVALQYVKGLCWVLKYYYQGCASWEWYFPYHYAPFASDFINIKGLSKKFSKGEPFKPIEQLMGVFPAASRNHVPIPFAKLMINPKSPIIDFYPEDFQIDLNGKKFAWQGVALLPFVDEKRLFKATAPFLGELTTEERQRNQLGEDRLYVGRFNKGYKLISKFYETETEYSKEYPLLIDGMSGLMLLSKDNVGIGG
jgi:5'-3' exoribonuclease 2